MAKYETYQEKVNIRNGSVVWAYAFTETREKTKSSLKQVPVKGRLSCHKYGLGPEGGDAFAPGLRPRFFVPFRKGSETDYAWSKAIDISSRCYADTEGEATQGYNQLIENHIAWYDARIQELRGMQI